MIELVLEQQESCREEGGSRLEGPHGIREGGLWLWLWSSQVGGAGLEQQGSCGGEGGVRVRVIRFLSDDPRIELGLTVV